MPIRVQCSQCGKEYQVGDDKAGRRFQCKVCQAAVVVPSASAAGDDFGDMQDDFGEYMSQPARPSSGKRSSSGKKGKKSKQASSGNGALLGIGIGAGALAIVAGVIFIFMRGGGDDQDAAGGGGGNNVAANTSTGAGGPMGQHVPVGQHGAMGQQGPMGGHGALASGGSSSTGGPATANTATFPAPQLTAAQIDTVKRNLHQLALSMHNFHDVHVSLPLPSNAPAEWRDANGRPHLSWRVHILPYLDQQNLYNQFHLNEPWDSPHNLALAEMMPSVFHTPGDDPASTTTHYMVFTGGGAPFGDVGPRFAEFQDGLSNTIMVAHVATRPGVPWTKPEDIVFDPSNPMACVGTVPPYGMPVVLGDGATVFVNPQIDALTFGYLVQHRDLNAFDSSVLLRDPVGDRPSVQSFVPPMTPPSGPLHLAYMTDDCIGLVRISPQQLISTPWIAEALPPGFENEPAVPIDSCEEAIFWIVPDASGTMPAEPDSQFALTFSDRAAAAQLSSAQRLPGQMYAHSATTLVFGQSNRFANMFSGSGAGSPIAGAVRSDQLDADVYLVFQLQSESFAADWGEARPILALAGDLGMGLLDAEQVQLAFRANESPLLKLWLTFPQQQMAANYATAIEQQLPLLIQSQSRNPDAGRLVSLLSNAWSVATEGATVSFEIEHSEQLTTEIASVVSKALIQPAVAASAEARSRNNMFQLLIAAHNYTDTWRAMPISSQQTPALDEEGKPYLSWRVHLLPFIDQQALYEDFHLNEPWDSEHNIELLERMPDLYHVEDENKEELDPGMTRIVRVDGPGTLFENGLGGGFQDITDGSSNTAFCFVVGPDNAVPWTKPEDIVIDFTKPIIPQLDLQSQETFMVGMCDGSARNLPTSIDNEMLRRLLIHNDGEVVELPQ